MSRSKKSKSSSKTFAITFIALLVAAILTVTFFVSYDDKNVVSGYSIFDLLFPHPKKVPQIPPIDTLPPPPVTPPPPPPITIDDSGGDTSDSVTDDVAPCIAHPELISYDSAGTSILIAGGQCDDGNECTDDSCSNGACTHTKLTGPSCSLPGDREGAKTGFCKEGGCKPKTCEEMFGGRAVSCPGGNNCCNGNTQQCAASWNGRSHTCCALNQEPQNSAFRPDLVWCNDKKADCLARPPTEGGLFCDGANKDRCCPKQVVIGGTTYEGGCVWEGPVPHCGIRTRSCTGGTTQCGEADGRDRQCCTAQQVCATVSGRSECAPRPTSCPAGGSYCAGTGDYNASGICCSAGSVCNADQDGTPRCAPVVV